MLKRIIRRLILQQLLPVENVVLIVQKRYQGNVRDALRLMVLSQSGKNQVDVRYIPALMKKGCSFVDCARIFYVKIYRS